ncbi:S8 family serine peptidase [Solirubrobacter phytolaccae]|uniref:S8 family serine peptidase n=1 Tax=Solirubrobacter phytolaccae TaxID=1404360 RepID=A0A9X3NI47_9ACTN|nr:S8 family serine peptidase [Solirubrobacter phytolaccae]MDA0181647.1 S8 family serine peptidase [Solirubrobacter phytolaccae]
MHCHRPKAGRARLRAPTPFTTVSEAARRGALDPALATQLDAGVAVEALAILDDAGRVPSLGVGTPRQITGTRTAIADLRRPIAHRSQVQVLQTYQLVPLVHVRIASPAAAVALLNTPEVRSIAADEVRVSTTASSLPRISQPPVLARSLMGQGVGVAVLDTGVDFTQPDFGACVAAGQAATPADVCRVSAALDTAPDDGALDAHGHGSNVAGIVSAVAPGARILALDVFDGLPAHDHDVIEALDWVLRNRAKHNIRAVNMSFGSDSHHLGSCDSSFWGRHPYTNALIGMRSAGIVPVASSGNSARDGSGNFVDGIGDPACVAFAVGGTDDSDALRPGSQDGPQLGVLAPGTGITAGGRTMGGTSQAAPHVAGAVAVLASLRPQSTPQELQDFVRTSGTQITDPRSGRTHPRLDLMTAVRAAHVVPNDNRAAARAITAWGTQLEQPTWTASKEPGEPAHAGNAGGASVWFKWTVPRAGSATLSTFGSSYDTLLATYREGPGGQLTALAANDDAPGQKTSQLAFGVVAGDVVWIAVDGKVGPAATPFPAAGRLRMTLNLANDNLADAVTLTPGTTAFGANVGATREAGEPHHCGDTFASASVWHRWTASADTVVSVAVTDETFALCVAAYQSAASAPGPSALSLVRAASNEQGDTPAFTFQASAQKTYWIAVEGASFETACHPVTGQCFFASQTGAFKLLLTTNP